MKVDNQVRQNLISLEPKGLKVNNVLSSLPPQKLTASMSKHNRYHFEEHYIYIVSDDMHRVTINKRAGIATKMSVIKDMNRMSIIMCT